MAAGPILKVGLVGDVQSDAKAQAKAISAEMKELNRQITEFVKNKQDIPPDLTKRMAELEQLKKQNVEARAAIKESNQMKGEIKKTLKDFGREAGFKVGSSKKAIKIIEDQAMRALVTANLAELSPKVLLNAGVFYAIDRYTPRVVESTANLLANKLVNTKFAQTAMGAGVMAWLSKAGVAGGPVGMIAALGAQALVGIGESMYGQWRKSQDFGKEVTKAVQDQMMDPSYAAWLMKSSKDTFTGKLFGWMDDETGRAAMEQARLFAAALEGGNIAQQKLMEQVLGPAMANKIQEEAEKAIEKRERDYPMSDKQKEQVKAAVFESFKHDIQYPYYKLLEEARKQGNEWETVNALVEKERERYREFYKAQGLKGQDIEMAMPDIMQLKRSIEMGLSPYGQDRNLSFEELRKKLKEADKSEAVDIQFYGNILKKVRDSQMGAEIEAQIGPKWVPENSYILKKANEKVYDDAFKPEPWNKPEVWDD